VSEREREKHIKMVQIDEIVEMNEWKKVLAFRIIKANKEDVNFLL
jgi:hypothetical protein